MIRCALSGDPITCFWSMIPQWAQWGLIACLALFVGGILWRVWAIAKQFGGWPSALAAVGAIGILVGAFWPKHTNRAAEPGAPPWQSPDFDPPPARPKKKRRPTIFNP